MASLFYLITHMKKKLVAVPTACETIATIKNSI